MRTRECWGHYTEDAPNSISYTLNKHGQLCSTKLRLLPCTRLANQWEMAQHISVLGKALYLEPFSMTKGSQ